MPSFDTDVPVLLLRLDRNPYHHGTLGAARSLGRTGVEVHALVDPVTGPVTRSRFLHRVHAPPPRGPVSGAREASRFTDEDIEHLLVRVSDAIGKRAVLVPLDDRCALAAAALSARLAGRYLLPPVAPQLPARLADKAELAAVCERLGIPHPATVRPDSAAEAAREAAALGLPAVAKWSRPWLLPSGLRSTALVRTPREAARLYERTELAGSRLLLQRRLPGGHGLDWFFHGYAAEHTAAAYADGPGDSDGPEADSAGGAGGSAVHGTPVHGPFLIGGAGRKDRSWPPRTGLTAVGTWLPNPPVEEAAERLAAALGYRGILDLDFRLDTATGAYHLLDFNPRAGAQFRLFTDDAGLDVVRAQHLHLTGRPVPAPDGGPSRVFVAENYAVLSALAAPPGARPAGPRKPRGPVERAWFAADDPLPFAAMAAAWLGRCLRKAGGRARSAVPVRAAVSGRPTALPAGAAESPAETVPSAQPPERAGEFAAATVPDPAAGPDRTHAPAAADRTAGDRTSGDRSAVPAASGARPHTTGGTEARSATATLPHSSAPADGDGRSGTRAAERSQ